MAVTQNTYTGNGSTVLYSFTFPYLETTDVKVTVNGTITTAYTFANATTIQFNTAPLAGAAIRIYRQTDDSSLRATFYSGSAIRAQDLNDDFTQNLYVAQEVNNNALDIDGSNPMVGDLNMGGYKVTNLATPVAGTDAANRSFVEGVFSSEVPYFYRRWSKTAVGGETSLSGNDNSGIALSYVPGSEKVFINGALQVRGVDYTGTTGTTLTAIPALTAGDIVEVHSSSNYLVGTVPDGSVTNAKVDGAAAIQSTKLAFIQAGTGATTRTVESKLRDVVSVKDFGAVGDGVTNDTAAIQAAIDYVAAAGGGTVVFSDKHLIDSNLTIKDYVCVRGPLDLADEILPGNTADYDSKRGVLLVNSAATISLLDGASISNCLVLRKGLNLPFIDATSATAGVAAFSGTAFTVNGAGTYFHHLMILGFNKAIYSSNNERIRCEYINGDCTNGIEIRVCYDISYVENCHFWPWTTTHQGWTTNTLLTRSGAAYKFAAVGDWSKFTNCFSFGYAEGFVIDSCDHVQLIGCGTDHVAAISGNTSVGYTTSGTSRNTSFIGCQAAAQGTGILVNSTTSHAHKISNCDFWGNDTYNIDVVLGRVGITGCTFDGVANRYAAGTQGYFSDNYLNGTTTTFGTDAERAYTVLGNKGFQAGPQSSISLDNDSSTTNMWAANSTGLGYIFRSYASNGTLSSPIISDAGVASLHLRGYLYSGSSFGELGSIRIQGAATPTSSSTPGTIVFSVNNNSLSVVDRLQLSAGGNLLPITDNVNSLGQSGLRYSAVWAANGTIQTSDSRTKTDINDCTLGLDFISSLRPVSYKFIEGGKTVERQVYRDSNGEECDPQTEGAIPAEIIAHQNSGQRTHWGLIAQEVKETIDFAGVDFGGWVLTDKDDPDSQQALRYDQFIAPLIKAVQELSARVSALENDKNT
jgi:hypothetical protein